jgi:hypothetical protein
MSQAQAPSVRRTLRCAALALTCTAFAWGPVKAQSEASLVLSALPVASVIGTVVAPSVLVAGGAVLTVKAIESTARGTVVVLERASDGARATLQFSGRVLEGASIAVGAVVAVTAISTGYILSEAGRVLCLVPNELGKALLHNERITF